jgi:hypothetical protein
MLLQFTPFFVKSLFGSINYFKIFDIFPITTHLKKKFDLRFCYCFQICLKESQNPPPPLKKKLNSLGCLRTSGWIMRYFVSQNSPKFCKTLYFRALQRNTCKFIIFILYFHFFFTIKIGLSFSFRHHYCRHGSGSSIILLKPDPHQGLPYFLEIPVT